MLKWYHVDKLNKVNCSSNVISALNEMNSIITDSYTISHCVMIGFPCQDKNDSCSMSEFQTFMKKPYHLH